MPLTAAFTANPQGFSAQRAVFVMEPDGLTAGLAAGANHVLAPALMRFNFRPNVATAPGSAICVVTNGGAPPLSVPCYFLPYLPDGATTTTLGAGANFFFTSQMTGCSVQVHGPAATPTVTHSNAKSAFMNYAGGGGLAGATGAAQIAINNMLPAVPMGQAASTVTRLTMTAAMTAGNLAAAGAGYGGLQPGYRLKEMTAVTSNAHGTEREETGMFVYGIRDPVLGNWEFFRSITVHVKGRQKTGKTYAGFIKVGVTNRTIDDDVVLGGSPRFWP
jgi:hypothetical protein